MSRQGVQQRIVRRSTRRSRAITTSYKTDENTTEKQPIQQQLQDQRLYQDYECAICLDFLSNPYIIPECCHRFCCDCIHKSIETGNKECPTCRVHIASRQSLRRDELFGKLLTRLLKVRSKVEMLRSKERMMSTSLLLENEETNDIDEQGLNELKESQNELTGSKKRIFNDEKSGQTCKKRIFRSFDVQITKLQQFKMKNGHCNVPRKYKDDPPLGRWVQTMRYAYKQTKLGNKTRTKLTQSMIKQLQEMEFQWEIQKYGHCNVPHRCKDDPSLGQWVTDIRAAYKKIKLGISTKRNLSQSKIEQLEEMGFQWQLRK